jgi:predicted nucleic acid-binding protein
VVSLLVDIGFLVALYIRGDTLHDDAVAYLRGNRAALLTVAPVIVETWVWLANARGVRRILTVDETDFSLFRLKHGKTF